jgi:hypothetical protein
MNPKTPTAEHNFEASKPYAPVIYRSNDGKSFYKFRFVKIGENFEILILEQPSYQSRSQDLKSTCRLFSENGYKIDTSSINLKTLLKTHEFAIKWSQRTDLYIKFGVEFSTSELHKD